MPGFGVRASIASRGSSPSAMVPSSATRKPARGASATRTSSRARPPSISRRRARSRPRRTLYALCSDDVTRAAFTARSPASRCRIGVRRAARATRLRLGRRRARCWAGSSTRGTPSSSSRRCSHRRVMNSAATRAIRRARRRARRIVRPHLQMNRADAARVQFGIELRERRRAGTAAAHVGNRSRSPSGTRRGPPNSRS